MSPWSLLAVPVCLGVMVALLVGISWFEERLLSPPSLIRYTARSRHVGPDTVELFVAAQSERILKGMNVPSRPVAPAPASRPQGAPASRPQAAPASVRP